ncbi:MAG TPA: hypothetical protein PK140_19725 [Polyangiaceae bacterium]|nr:hypothetical protein [Polyangiaceae bacterium]
MSLHEVQKHCPAVCSDSLTIQPKSHRCHALVAGIAKVDDAYILPTPHRRDGYAPWLPALTLQC